MDSRKDGWRLRNVSRRRPNNKKPKMKYGERSSVPS
jgi:hypothetical protein